MRKILIIINIILIPFSSFSQDTIKKDLGRKKSHFSIRAGIGYKNFFGKKYIGIVPSIPSDYEKHQYDGFTKVPTFGFQAGIVWSCKIYRNFHFSLGLVYYLRKDVYKGDYDTVMKYHTLTSIHNIIKYTYSLHNIEIPVLFSYKLKKFNISLGMNLALLTFNRARYSYIPDPNINNGIDSKTITGMEFPKKIFPTFLVSYDVKIINLSLSPFLGIEMGSKNAYYIQGGIILPLKQDAFLKRK